MTTVQWRKRISAGPVVHCGIPCIISTRVTVNVIVRGIAHGSIFERVPGSYPQLKREDIGAALLRAAEAVNRYDLVRRLSLRRPKWNSIDREGRQRTKH